MFTAHFEMCCVSVCVHVLTCVTCGLGSHYKIVDLMTITNYA